MVPSSTIVARRRRHLYTETLVLDEICGAVSWPHIRLPADAHRRQPPVSTPFCRRGARFADLAEPLTAKGSSRTLRQQTAGSATDDLGARRRGSRCRSCSGPTPLEHRCREVVDWRDDTVPGRRELHDARHRAGSERRPVARPGRNPVSRVRHESRLTPTSRSPNAEPRSLPTGHGGGRTRARRLDRARYPMGQRWLRWRTVALWGLDLTRRRPSPP